MNATGVKSYDSATAASVSSRVTDAGSSFSSSGRYRASFCVVSRQAVVNRYACELARRPIVKATGWNCTSLFICSSLEHALQVHIDHAVPVVDLAALKEQVWHETRIVEHDIDPAVGLNGCVDQMFDLSGVGDIGRDSQRYAAVRYDCVGRSVIRSSRRAPNTTTAPCDESRRAVASPRPLLAPVITTTLSLMFCVMTGTLVAREARRQTARDNR